MLLIDTKKGFQNDANQSNKSFESESQSEANHQFENLAGTK